MALKHGVLSMFSSHWRSHTFPCCSLCLKNPIPSSFSSSVISAIKTIFRSYLLWEADPKCVNYSYPIFRVWLSLLTTLLTPNKFLFLFLAPTNSPTLGTPTGCLRIHSDTNYPALAQSSQIKSSSPQDGYHFNTHCKSQPPILLTNHF